jgi:solute carrier family 25 S-adenosylmethionine transporter 26
MSNSDFTTYLLSGAVAGTSVDVVLFPLDTIKTRMQSAAGFWASGGYRGIYNGLGSAAAGSAPTAALFFVTYEMSKTYLTPTNATHQSPWIHCLSASLGELVACCIRVPTENVKQKVQAGLYSTSMTAFRALLASGVSHFYTGYSTTILREIPFALIQFPLFEYLKSRLDHYHHSHGRSISPLESAVCGSFAGGIAAAVTCPLDVIKTRLMTQLPLVAITETGTTTRTSTSVVNTIRSIYVDGGGMKFFSGIAPRVMWISIGGFVFFGAYESSKRLIARVRGDSATRV